MRDTFSFSVSRIFYALFHKLLTAHVRAHKQQGLKAAQDAACDAVGIASLDLLAREIGVDDRRAVKIDALIQHHNPEGTAALDDHRQGHLERDSGKDGSASGRACT